jgi:hypothetical protein
LKNDLPVAGLGQNYILNMPPSKDGIIEPNMAQAAAAFGKERLRRCVLRRQIINKLKEFLVRHEASHRSIVG